MFKPKNIGFSVGGGGGGGGGEMFTYILDKLCKALSLTRGVVGGKKML